MHTLVYNDCTIHDLAALAREILDTYPDERVFAFYGDLGAGKTTLIKELCKSLGVDQDVTSPTYAIINEYDAGGIDLVYHFDFYRIKNPEEALDIGYEEYLYSGNYCFMEWADRIEELLPGNFVMITVIKGDDEHARTITASINNR